MVRAGFADELVMGPSLPKCSIVLFPGGLAPFRSTK
jgi:hypothetical protein